MLPRLLLLVHLAAFVLGSTVASAQQLPLGVPMEDKPPTLSLPSATVPKALPPGFLPNKPSSKRGQFIIHGADLKTRTDIGQQCDAISDELTRLLRDTQEWSSPIVISIKTPPNLTLSEPAVRANFAQLSEGGFHLQLNVQIRPDYNSNDLRSELIRMLIAERILRDHKEITTTRTRILPDWFLVGVTEALSYRERSRPSALFAAVFKSGKVYGIEEILGVSPGTLDALSRTIYETSCCALVLALIEQPEGGLRMSKFLNALATDNRSDRELINQWFPGIAQSKASLDKWWALQMANMSRPSVFENLDPGETAKALDEALMLRFDVEAGSETAVAEAPKKKAAPEAEEAPSEKPEAGFFGRLFTRAEPSAEAKPKPDETPAKKLAPEPKPMTDEELTKSKQQGFFGRLFGSNGEDKPAKKDEAKTDSENPEDKKPEPKKEVTKPEANKEAPKREAPKPEAPKPELKKEEPKKERPKTAEPKKEVPPKAKEKPVDKPEDSAQKRPGLFSRLFSTDSKPDEKAKPEKKAESKKEALKPEPKKEPKKSDEKKDAALVLPPASRVVADLVWPAATALFDITQSFERAQSRFTFLGFGKKKTDDSTEEKAGDAKPAKKSDKKKEEPPPAKKKEEKKPEPKEEPKKAAPPAAKPAAKKMVINSLPLEDYARVLKRKDGKQVLTRTANELSALKQRAHPLFRTVIADYIQLISDIATGKAKDIDNRLKELNTRKVQVLTLAKSVQDYLDWFEASQTTKWSGLFDDYLRVPEMVEKELPKRTDPISQFLDEVEKERGK